MFICVEKHKEARLGGKPLPPKGTIKCKE